MRPRLLIMFCIFAPSLVGCHPSTYSPLVGVSRGEDGATLHVGSCESRQELVIRVIQNQDDIVSASDPVLWEIATDSRPPRELAVSLGTVPPGFEEAIPLARQPEPSERIVLVVTWNPADSYSQQAVGFTPEELPDSGVLRDDGVMTSREFSANIAEFCG